MWDVSTGEVVQDSPTHNSGAVTAAETGPPRQTCSGLQRRAQGWGIGDGPFEYRHPLTFSSKRELPGVTRWPCEQSTWSFS